MTSASRAAASSAAASSAAKAAAARSTAIVPYNAAAAELAKNAVRPSMLGRFGNYLKSGMTLGNAIGIGIPTGYSIYQMINDKKVAEQQERDDAAQAAADTAANDQYMKDQLEIQQGEVDKRIEELNIQISNANATEKLLKEQKAFQDSEFAKILLQQEEDKARQAKMDAEYEKQAQEQYQEMLAIQKQQIEEQIQKQLASLIRTAPPPSSRVPPSSTPAPPSSRAPPSSTPAPPRAAPPPNTSDPYAGMTARERAAAQRTGRGVIRDDLLSRLRGDDRPRRISGSAIPHQPPRRSTMPVKIGYVPVRPTPQPPRTPSRPIRYVGPAY